jgi:hypothetical protein
MKDLRKARSKNRQRNVRQRNNSKICLFPIPLPIIRSPFRLPVLLLLWMRIALPPSLFFLLNSSFLLSASAEPIHWNTWSPALFEQARREHRFVLLDLEAVWCHWCHVMDENTCADPAVIALIKSNYIAVRVDQDARPDLSNRYEDYGWPMAIGSTRILRKSCKCRRPICASTRWPAPGGTIQSACKQPRT